MQLIEWVYVIIFSVMIFSSTLWLMVYLLNRDEVHGDPEPSSYPSITFLIPAYNEEEYISECIQSVIDQNYPDDKLDVIAVNDGSRDNTLQEMKKFSDRIEILDKPNTGKSNSINQALNQASTEIVGCLDADSVLDEDFLKNMVGYFEQDGVKGVTPAMRIEKPTTLAQKAVWVEYVYNLMLRKIFSLFNAQFVMPGPGSLYRTEFLKEIGGWDESTLTEDMEIVFRMVDKGARLKNSTNAEVITHSPETLKGLLKQRSRWYRGNIRNMVRYRGTILNPEYGSFGGFVLPWNLLWTGMVMFLTLHLGYRLMTGIGNLFTGPLLFSFSPSIQMVSVFHIFQAMIVILGAGMLLATIKTSPKSMEFRNKKSEIAAFMAAYSFLYSIFWIKALRDMMSNYESEW